MKRVFDLVLSIIGLILLTPFLLVIMIAVRLDSKGGVFYLQPRIGRFGKEFKLMKFRTMRPNSDQRGLLTVGAKDSRVTRMGYYLRKYKLDELPQLFNVIKGEMSLVGPRPEVKKYVDMYTEEQKMVLSILPGITDYASLEYINENELLARSEDPEETYIREIMPAKLALNLEYIGKHGVLTDMGIILKTVLKIIR